MRQNLTLHTEERQPENILRKQTTSIGPGPPISTTCLDWAPELWWLYTLHLSPMAASKDTNIRQRLNSQRRHRRDRNEIDHEPEWTGSLDLVVAMVKWIVEINCIFCRRD